MSKRTALLCSLSALAGAVAAIGLHDLPAGPQTVAQEAVPYVPPRAGTVPRPPAVALPPVTAEQAVAAPWLTAEERVNIAVYETVNRSAVNIVTESAESDGFFLREIPSKGEGSGTVIDRQGHVLTANHVVDGARSIQVTLFNGKSYPAEMVGQDPSTDTAVLRIDAPLETLYPVVFGSSADLKVGQRVFAIGNPFGLERTLSTGIVSSLNRSLPRRRGGSFKSIIQIDAAINPGNSGGPLLDSRGHMIGMTTMIASRTGESAGVGFAIPVATIARVVPALLRDGRIIRADLGIAAVYRTERGLLIAELLPGGAAAKAGMKGPQVVNKRQGPFVFRTIDRMAADLIVAVDGQPIRTSDDLLGIVEAKKPGDEVVVTVVRGGRQQDISVRLGTSE